MYGLVPERCASDRDVIILCEQLALSHMNDEIRKSALERFAEIAHSSINAVAFVKRAQSTMLSIFKRLR